MIKEFQTFNMHGKWFMMVFSGIKIEEYRDISAHYVKQFFDVKKAFAESDSNRKGSFIQEMVDDLNILRNASRFWKYCKISKDTELRFINGMKPPEFLPRFTVSNNSRAVGNTGVWIGHGLSEWGAETGKLYFIFDVGQLKSCFNIDKVNP